MWPFEREEKKKGCLLHKTLKHLKQPHYKSFFQTEPCLFSEGTANPSKISFPLGRNTGIQEKCYKRDQSKFSLPAAGRGCTQTCAAQRQAATAALWYSLQLIIQRPNYG